MTHNIRQLIRQVNQRLEALAYGKEPASLYEPIRYVMSLGGKRLRPILVLLAYKLFKNKHEDILDQALAVEVFHNFTLIHDDIMDKAPLRRGQQTVHHKWNESTAILSGDVMMIKTYELLLDASSPLKNILKDLNTCAVGVCEGQQLDMNFETLPTVTEAQYINMIRLKTAVLLGFSLKLGAMLAEAPTQAADALYAFGVDIGIGFQLKDDLLDAYADQKKFGKQIGGDIITNKKTFLLLKALEHANDIQAETLNDWISRKEFDPAEKVKAVKTIYDQMGIRKLTLSKMNNFFNKGFERLKQIDVVEEKKKPLIEFTNYLIDREE